MTSEERLGEAEIVAAIRAQKPYMGQEAERIADVVLRNFHASGIVLVRKDANQSE